MKIYVGQTNLTLSMITNVTLTNVTTALIKYIKPDSTEGSWTGTVNNTLVEYGFQTGDLNVSGTYTAWVYITFSNGKISIGEPSTFIVYNQGE